MLPSCCCRGSPNAQFWWFMAATRGHNSRIIPPVRGKTAKNGAGEGKISRNFGLPHSLGPHPSVPHPSGPHPFVQDMYTRLLSANLDFDSELLHAFCWEPDECRDSRVFHVDGCFSSSLLNAVSRVWLGCVERYTWLAVFDENTLFWSRYVVLLDPAKTLVSFVLLLSGRQRWTSAEHVALSISVFMLSPFYSAWYQSVFLERYRED